MGEMNQNWNKYEVLNSWNRGNELKVKHVSCIRIIYLFLVKYILSKKLYFMKKRLLFTVNFFMAKKWSFTMIISMRTILSQILFYEKKWHVATNLFYDKKWSYVAAKLFCGKK